MKYLACMKVCSFFLKQCIIQTSVNYKGVFLCFVTQKKSKDTDF